ncbi:hypothetical protein ACH79_28165 [Bradyrhizobium sp. CCBAU 051011]|nr:hypothetical protein ACH79_28165 [Bradyrhizobium sp. CCBAU 051011]
MNGRDRYCKGKPDMIACIADRILPAGSGGIDGHCRKQHEELQDHEPGDDARSGYDRRIKIEGRSIEVIDRILRLRERT